jgi:hypothetical protein
MDEADRAVVEERASCLDISWVTERIAVGGWIETDEKREAVARLGITHVIDMAWESDDTPLERFGIRVLLNTTDDDFQVKSPELLQRGVEFARRALQEPGSKLFIHCVAGRHRGPMMTLAVLCGMGWSMEEGMRTIAKRRAVVDWAPAYVESVAVFLRSYSHNASAEIETTSARSSGN